MFTSGNLFCGCLAIAKAFEGDLVWTAYFVGIAAFLDFFDGFAARALKVTGEFGKQLDSLADCVTFGVVPGVVMFKLMEMAAANSGAIERNPESWNIEYLPYIGFLISIFSALRLAKFNLDTRQSESFIGLPTPANSILICSLPLVLRYFCFVNDTPTESAQGFYNCFIPDDMPRINFIVRDIILNSYFLIFLTMLMSYLLIAELPLFALKFKNFKWKGNEIRFIFLGLSGLLLAFLQFAGLPIIILLYVLLSLIQNLSARKSAQA